MELTYYLIWASAGLTLFYGAYRVLFNDDVSPLAHRVYLVTTTAGALLLPFIPFRLPAGMQSTQINAVMPDLTGYEITTGSVSTPSHTGLPDLTSILTILYVSVALLLVCRMIWHLCKLLRLYQQSEKRRAGELIIAEHPAVTAPFSFFNLIFIQKNANTEEVYEQIIAHEKVHATELHSVDMLLTELLTAILWFHPLAWRLKKKVVLIHEYLADYGVLRTGVDKTTYQVNLLNQLSEGRLIRLSSNFNNSLIKKRILMMRKSNQKTKLSMRLLALIPVILSLAFIIACSNTEELEPANEVISNTEVSYKDATFVLDGEKVAQKVIDNLDESDIQRVNIVKTEDGDQFEITTKPVKKQNVSFEDARKLVVVDGVTMDDDFEISTIGKENIKSVNILGVEKEIRKYTNGDYDRVVLIETK